MNIPKLILVNTPRPIPMLRLPIILLHLNRIPPHPHNPRHMAPTSGIRMRNTPHLRRRIHHHARLFRRLVPFIRNAPFLPLVPIRELDAQPFINPPCYEADAFASVVMPGVDAVAFVAFSFVGVVVFDRAREVFFGRGGGCFAFGGDEAVCAGFDVVVGYVAVVGGFVPDGVAVYGFACCLAGEGYVFALWVGLFDGVGGSWAGAAVYVVGFDGVGGGEGEGGCLEEGGEEEDLHFEVVRWEGVGVLGFGFWVLGVGDVMSSLNAVVMKNR